MHVALQLNIQKNGNRQLRSSDIYFVLTIDLHIIIIKAKFWLYVIFLPL